MPEQQTGSPQNTPPQPLNNPWEALADEELQTRLQEAVEAEERHAEQAAKVADKVGKLLTASQFRAANVRDAAEVVNQRRVTDPYSHGARTQKITERPDGTVEVTYTTTPDPQGPGESTLGKFTTAPLTGRVAGKYGVADRNGSASAPIIPRSDKEMQLPANELTSRQRRRLVRAEKRLQRQRTRQAESRWAEGVYSAGQGLGHESKIRTVLDRRSTKKDLEGQFERGEISAAELLSLQEQVDHQTVTIPVKAVRREVNKERIGGAAAVVLASQPIRGNRRDKKLAAKMEDLHEKARAQNNSRDTRLSIEREYRRRNGIPEPPPVVHTRTPNNPQATPNTGSNTSPLPANQPTPWPENQPASEIDTWEETLRFISGDYRTDDPGKPLEAVTLESLTAFIIARHGLIQKHATAKGWDPNDLKPMQREIVEKAAYMEVRTSVTATFKNLLSQDIISKNHEKDKGFAVTKDGQQLQDTLTEYKEARDARKNRGHDNPRGQRPQGRPSSTDTNSSNNPAAQVHGANVPPKYATHFDEINLEDIYYTVGRRIKTKRAAKEAELGRDVLSSEEMDEINVDARDEIITEYGDKESLPLSIRTKIEAELERIHQTRMGRRKSS